MIGLIAYVAVAIASCPWLNTLFKIMANLTPPCAIRFITKGNLELK